MENKIQEKKQRKFISVITKWTAYFITDFFYTG